MGYFQGLTNASFKKDQKGNTVFFPWGVLGRGRVIPDEPTETKVRAFLSRYYKVSLPTMIVVGVVVGWAWSFLLIPIFGAWFYFGSKSLVSEYPYSEDKLTLKEGYTSSAAGHNKVTLWLLFTCSTLFVLAGIFIASVATSPSQIVMGLFTAIFFGACSAAIGYMLKMKRNA
ncbi:hypothetical protein RAE19_10910 [Rhodoferax sp. TBRC 17660]|uniref:DUF3796 domain-containing protein n=1 Tax=Rhodoferax potami TaxID=3068338 RepID=A0ABU3KP17_9BURK|nr:hypothetical protein [Rhodoferax sp. TBRC 17660]MDT7519216.1 hypothetical protein [Rhodoferax sp. TBRC 17660]